MSLQSRNVAFARDPERAQELAEHLPRQQHGASKGKGKGKGTPSYSTSLRRGRGAEVGRVTPGMQHVVLPADQPITPRGMQPKRKAREKAHKKKKQQSEARERSKQPEREQDPFSAKNIPR